jgi:hypothetical protein
MVTATTNDPGQASGQVLDWTGCITFSGTKQGSGAIARGDLLVPDTGATPDGWKISPASAGNPGPFAVCLKAAAATDTALEVAQGGTQALKAGGTIEINKLVMSDSGTAGKVIVYAPSAVVVTTLAGAEIVAAAADFTRVVGECLGFVGTQGTIAATAPVSGDLAAVKMRIA